MIKIKKSPNADARSAIQKVDKIELRRSSIRHIWDVEKIMLWMTVRIKEIGHNHDYTKLSFLDEFYDDYKLSQEGFQGDFKQRHWFQDLHLQERHHLTDRCPEDVNLFDVLERIADITAAGLARSGTVYEDSLSPEILAKAYNNTIKLVKDNVEVE